MCFASEISAARVGNTENQVVGFCVQREDAAEKEDEASINFGCNITTRNLYIVQYKNS
jgi:hypothetical protein